MTWAKAWRRLARDYSGRIQGLVRETRWMRKQLAAAEAEIEKARADGIAAVDATVRAAREEAVTLRAALMEISTDNAQDALEDPVGHADREAAGFYRIGRGAMNAARAALKGTT